MPMLIYEDVGKALEWLCVAFGFTERLRAPGPDGNITHAQLAVGEGAIMLGAARTGFRLFHNHLTVNLVSAVFERDSEVWLRLLRSVRRDILTETARHRVSLIMTGVFSGTSEHAEAWRTMLEPVRTEGEAVVE